MAATYFTLPSLGRTQKKSDLPSPAPQPQASPVLKDADVKLFEKKVESPEAVHVQQAASSVPADGKTSGNETANQESVMPSRQTPSTFSTPNPSHPRKKEEDFFPSQEDAEAATGAHFASIKSQESPDQPQSQQERRTWSEFLSSYAKPRVGGSASDDTATEETGNEKSQANSQQRSWAQYASSYVPSQVASSIPALPSWKKDIAEEKHEGASDQNSTESAQPSSIDDAVSTDPTASQPPTNSETPSQQQQERDITTLLSRLNMSAINNRVFALSAETQKFHERFAQVLKDTINGVPTAYRDMDTLLREAGPHLEKQYKALPSFVQALIKTIPAKLSASLGPEVLAASAKKPGDEIEILGEKQAASSKTKKKTTRRRLPTLKSLLSREGAVAGILRSVMNFLRVRFPFLASGTNVVMSLSVFILMFVLWYCYKRGRETRLATDAENPQEKSTSSTSQDPSDINEEETDIEIDPSDDDEDNADEILAAQATDDLPPPPLPARPKASASVATSAATASSAPSARELQDLLERPEPASVPLPREE